MRCDLLQKRLVGKTVPNLQVSLQALNDFILMIDQLVKRLTFVNDFFVKFPWINNRRKRKQARKRITFCFSSASLVVGNIKHANDRRKKSK